jgi:hypothetical protein
MEQLGEIRALAVAEMHSRGQSYKRLADDLSLSAPRVGQLVSSADEASLSVIRAWIRIETAMKDLLLAAGRSVPDSQVVRQAIDMLARSGRFSREFMADISYFRQLRSGILHGGQSIGAMESQRIVSRSEYIAAAIQLHKTEELPLYTAEMHRTKDEERSLQSLARVSREVPWDYLSPARFEQMVSVLISRLNPDAERIDGAGGDSGRDLQLRTDQGLILFELKSFTGRLSKARRVQIIRSLERAKDLSPIEWQLVLPIDLTPEEILWFDRVTGEAGFPCRWLGRTWLDAEFAKFPEIARYYLDDANQEIVDALRELAREQAALARGVPDAIDRLQDLTARLNGLDPQYAFGLSSAPDGTVEVTIWPRYSGATNDRPITVQSSFNFPLTDDGRAAAESVREALDFGLPANIPAENVRSFDVSLPGGLTIPSTGIDLQIQSVLSGEVESIDLDVRVVNEYGTAVAQMPFRGGPKTRGLRGGIIELKDYLGYITLSLKVDLSNRNVQARYEAELPTNVLPCLVIPAARLLAEFRAGYRVVLLHEGRQIMESPIAATVNEAAAGYLDFMIDLDSIQRRAGVYFAVPDSLTEDDMYAIWSTKRLLDGQTMKQRWSGMKITIDADAARALRAGGKDSLKDLVVEGEQILTLGAYDVPVGRVRRVINSFAVPSWPADIENLPDSALVELSLQPELDDVVEVTLVSAGRPLAP